MSYSQLLTIAQEANQIVKDEKAQPPVACPNDGEPLRKNSRGILYCPFDGWRYNGPIR